MLSDFEGFVPPFDRESFKETLEALERGAAPGEALGLHLLLAGVPLQEDDLGRVEDYVKALDIEPVEGREACTVTLVAAAGTAAAYRHAGLADAVAEKGAALFPKVKGHLKRELLRAILDAGNAREAAGVGWAWAARVFERLASGATHRGELAALAALIRTLRVVDPESGPYFAAVDAVIRLREKHVTSDTRERDREWKRTNDGPTRACGAHRS